MTREEREERAALKNAAMNPQFKQGARVRLRGSVRSPSSVAGTIVKVKPNKMCDAPYTILLDTRFEPHLKGWDGKPMPVPCVGPDRIGQFHDREIEEITTLDLIAEV